MVYPAGSCCTQSKVPCSLSEATLVRPKVKILFWSPLSEQGTVMLCDTNKPKLGNKTWNLRLITDNKLINIPLDSR